MSLTCEDVRYVDEKFNYNLALYTVLGCQPITPKLINTFHNSKVPVIAAHFASHYYATPQPKSPTQSEFSKIISDAVNDREFFALLTIASWWSSLSSEENSKINFELFSHSDPIVRKLSKTLFAANGLLEDADFSWKLDEFDTIEVLMSSQLIPYVADYLSYAYSNGKGVTKNFKEVERLSSYASETIPEAKRYLAMELASVDFAKALKMIEEAKEVGYLPAIEDYYFLLSDRLETYPDAKNKIKNMVPQLEALGYSGDSVFQRILGDLYAGGVIIEANEKRAVSWYKKAASQDDALSADYLTEYYSRLGEYDKAAFMLAISAELGWVWKHGYFELFHMINLSYDDWPDPKKLLEYIKFHCLNNDYVSESDRDVCVTYPAKNVTFESIIPLEDALNDSANLKYINELKLPTGNYHALLIGNQNYDNWENLKTPKEDIKRVSQILEKEYNFETTKLVDASRNDILRAIYKLGDRVEFNDHVLVYYAGHGVLDTKTNEGYWVPSNADASFRPDWVSNSEIKTALKSINSRHLLVMADSCYSGTIVRSGSIIDNEISNSLLERLFMKKS